MIIDHIGVVVKSIEEAINQWEKLFDYRQFTEIITNTRQKVKVVFMLKEGSVLVKLVEPIDATSPVFGAAIRGGGINHICFKCENIREEINRLRNLGMRLITKSEPGEAFENHDIAFLMGKNGLNIELIDTNVKAKKIHQLINPFI